MPYIMACIVMPYTVMPHTVMPSTVMCTLLGYFVQMKVGDVFCPILPD